MGEKAGTARFFYLLSSHKKGQKLPLFPKVRQLIADYTPVTGNIPPQYGMKLPDLKTERGS
jgi:hypothetical protein